MNFWIFSHLTTYYFLSSRPVQHLQPKQLSIEPFPSLLLLLRLLSESIFAHLSGWKCKEQGKQNSLTASPLKKNKKIKFLHMFSLPTKKALKISHIIIIPNFTHPSNRLVSSEQTRLGGIRVDKLLRSKLFPFDLFPGSNEISSHRCWIVSLSPTDSAVKWHIMAHFQIKQKNQTAWVEHWLSWKNLCRKNTTYIYIYSS